MFNHYKKFKELQSFKNCFYIKEYPMNYDKINIYIPVLIQWYSLCQESVVRGRPEFPNQLVYNKEHENFKHP